MPLAMAPARSPHPIERKDRVPRPPDWISRSTRSRIACTISSGSRGSRSPEPTKSFAARLESCRDARFELPGLAENVHGQFIFEEPGNPAAVTISPATGAALPAP